MNYHQVKFFICLLLWYLNTTFNKKHLKFNFPHETGKRKYHIKHATLAYSPAEAGKMCLRYAMPFHNSVTLSLPQR